MSWIASWVGAPLKLLSKTKNYDISAHVRGGGVPAQAEAVSLGIARALLGENEEFKGTLKKAGLLTRDAGYYRHYFPRLALHAPHPI